MAPPPALFRALYDFAATDADELSLRAGDVVRVSSQQDDGWWYGIVAGDGEPRGGLFPGTYVAAVADAPPEAAPAEAAPAPPAPEDDDGGLEAARRASSDALAAFAAAAVDVEGAGGAAAGGEAAPAAPEPAAPRDETLELILELERRAAAAEASLAEERAAAAAFREATTASLAILESTLTRALAPLGGVVLLAPGDAGDAFFGDGAAGGSGAGARLAAGLGARLRPGPLGRRSVAWADLVDVAREALEAARPAAPPPPPRPAAAAAADDDDAPRVATLLARFAPPLRQLFKEYASQRPRWSTPSADGRGPRPPSGQLLLSPTDFLRLCRETRVCPGLLSRQEVTSVCRAALADAQGAPGLTEQRTTAALENVAAAAYGARLPAMSRGDALEALFIHMGLAERLIQQARNAPPSRNSGARPAPPRPVEAESPPPASRTRAREPAPFARPPAFTPTTSGVLKPLSKGPSPVVALGRESPAGWDPTGTLFANPYATPFATPGAGPKKPLPDNP